jgi:tripartite-type tricarboxylate transporter receptor subunit TctC
VKRQLSSMVAILAGVTLLAIGCSQAAPAPAPTSAPAPKPAATTAPASALTTAPTGAPAAPTAVPAKAAEYPGKDRPITLMVPVAAGSTSDIAGRLLAEVMRKELGVPSVEVINKPGASTQTCLTELAKAKPDGHTVSFFSFNLSLPTYLDKARTQSSYDRKDLQGVSLFTSEDTIIAVKGDSPYKSFKELADAAKAKPGDIKVADGGLMGTTHLAMLELTQKTGVKFSSVHFDGAAPALTAMLGGHVDAFASGAGALGSNVQSGAVRVIALLDSQRSPYLKEVPTLTEAGYNVVAASTQGIIVSAGTPKEAVAMLSAAVKKATEDPDLKAKLTSIMVTPKYMDTAEFEKFWADKETTVKALLPLAQQR